MAIKTLIVDDSPVARDFLKAVLAEEADFEVIGAVEDGDTALTFLKDNTPDLITMDLEMPGMNGFQCIQAIMQKYACPILVVSAVADAQKAYRAISYGAVDTIAKPSVDSSEQKAFVKKCRLISKVAVIKRIRNHGDNAINPHNQTNDQQTLKAQNQHKLPAFPVSKQPPETGEFDHVIAIASSTGGPQALAEFLPGLSKNLTSPVLIAQHISRGFSSGMADWLNSICDVDVKVPQDGETLKAGRIYLAPSEYHMEVSINHKIMLHEPGMNDLYHPNCDRLLESVARYYKDRTIGVILSGMGSDGCLGLMRIKEAGGLTFGQNEQSSVVYGMNQLAKKYGAVQKELPLSDMVQAIRRILGTTTQDTISSPSKKKEG